MKKTTLLCVCLLLSLKLFSQVTAYTDPELLNENFTGTIAIEDFTSGPAFPIVCGDTVSSAGNDCFEEGVIIPGFQVSASNGGFIVFLPADFLPSNNPTPRLGANAGVDFTVISFTENNVYAVGQSLHIDDNANFIYRVYNQQNALIYNETVAFTPFYGVISSDPISRVEIENVNNQGELLGDLMFGTGILGLNSNVATKFSYYPNPVNDVLTIQSGAAIAQVKVINMLGQVVLQTTTNSTNATISTAGLFEGSYIVETSLSNGATKTFRILKR